MGLPGHNESCYYCGEKCNSLAGSPGIWPIAMCHADDPGRVKWHHEKCVAERLLQRDALLAFVRRVAKAVPTSEYDAAWLVDQARELVKRTEAGANGA